MHTHPHTHIDRQSAVSALNCTALGHTHTHTDAHTHTHTHTDAHEHARTHLLLLARAPQQVELLLEVTLLRLQLALHLRVLRLVVLTQPPAPARALLRHPRAVCATVCATVCGAVSVPGLVLPHAPLLQLYLKGLRNRNSPVRGVTPGGVTHA
eukprot:1177567-Prorocentrum_minimum.AAC.1